MAKVKRPKNGNKTRRYQVRCTDVQLAAWEARAQALGFASAGAWLGKLADGEISTSIPAAR